MNKIKSILAENNINKTKFRVDLLKLFYSKKSLSVLEILDYFNSTVNKVTIYRSLKSFEKKCLTKMNVRMVHMLIIMVILFVMHVNRHFV